MKLKLDPKRLTAPASKSKKTYFVKTVRESSAPPSVSTDLSTREPTAHASPKPENTSWSL